MFENDPSVLYFSTHRYDRGKFYPHSTDASPEQIGAGKGAGYNVNVAWERHGMGDADYLHAWQRILIPGPLRFNGFGTTQPKDLARSLGLSSGF